MDAMVEVLEQELEGAFEVKDKKSLHRYVLLLTENIVRKESYQAQQLEIKSDIKILAEGQKQGFEQVDKRFEDMFRYMDKRFEQVDKRFEDMNNRFTDMSKKFTMSSTILNIGIGLIILMTIIFKFVS